MSPEEDLHFHDTRSILLYVVLPLILGIIISLFIRQPAVGIIEIKDPIDSELGKEVVEQIQYVYSHPEFKALVVLLDSPEALSMTVNLFISNSTICGKRCLSLQWSKAYPQAVPITYPWRLILFFQIHLQWLEMWA